MCKKELNPDFLISIGLSSIDSKYKSFFEGSIPIYYSCIDRLLIYYKIFEDTEDVPDILKLSTPCIINIFSENNITYKITVNNVLMGTFGDQDMNFIFRQEHLKYKLNLLEIGY